MGIFFTLSSFTYVHFERQRSSQTYCNDKIKDIKRFFHFERQVSLFNYLVLTLILAISLQLCPRFQSGIKQFISLCSPGYNVNFRPSRGCRYKRAVLYNLFRIWDCITFRGPFLICFQKKVLQKKVIQYVPVITTPDITSFRL